MAAVEVRTLEGTVLKNLLGLTENLNSAISFFDVTQYFGVLVISIFPWIQLFFHITGYGGIKLDITGRKRFSFFNYT